MESRIGMTGISFDPILTQLLDFVFSRASQAHNASEVADCDLHATRWKGADFCYGRRQASIGVHSDEKRSAHFGAVSLEGCLG